MTIKKSTQLTKLINDTKAEAVKVHEQTARIEQLKEKIESEIAQGKGELHELVGALIADPSDVNRAAEVKLRTKIEGLEKELESMADRQKYISEEFSKNSTKLLRESVDKAIQEAQSHINENVDAAAKRVEEAKYEYLLSLVAYHEVGNEAHKLVTGVQNELNTMYGTDKLPYAPEINLFYTAGDKQLHGIFQKEALDAMKFGIIEKTSVAEGRHILK
ncbi:hypothetical protein [Bacillus sp. UMB0893]|uniref:hypothetical protein n=1 Tax=Bacillus sp. UMB0893 TaxID=2066053 RepID=UPI000C774380|nr:hypothetical protein [Bacillus sp. UMB0893]PLR65979.1 hypothetical protein CYJ36_20100 [Bacillus sp. UMB0893]QNG60335.1 hypothetical protein H4O14_02050 [Bacillus sp. PAMC26568]